MLPRVNRISRRSDFEEVYKKSRSFHSPLFTLRRKDHTQGDTRFGIIVSNKISKKAVVRNKVKRRLREALRRLLPSLPQGSDYIIIAKAPLVNTPFKDIVDTLSRFLL